MVNPKIEESWKKVLLEEFQKPYFETLKTFLVEEKKSHTIYPSGANIFAAFEHTPFESVEVVILGQDPYHGVGQAHGLSFSVQDGVPHPPSLQNILKELRSDIGEKRSHDLTSWAEQGVLLLNACLTVPAGQANGHAGQIWEPFTDAVIKVVNDLEEPVVFILWGSYARKKKPLITHDRHLVLESAHPSPLSAYRGFFGSQPFSKTNQFLKEAGREPIDWLR